MCGFSSHETLCAAVAGLLKGASGGRLALPLSPNTRSARARSWIPELDFPKGEGRWPWAPTLELIFSSTASRGAPQHLVPTCSQEA